MRRSINDICSTHMYGNQAGKKKKTAFAEKQSDFLNLCGRMTILELRPELDLLGLRVHLGGVRGGGMNHNVL